MITRHVRVPERTCETSEKGVHRADQDMPGHVAPEVRNDALRPERDPHQRSSYAYIMLGRARKRRRFASHWGYSGKQAEADSAGGDEHG